MAHTERANAIKSNIMLYANCLSELVKQLIQLQTPVFHLICNETKRTNNGIRLKNPYNMMTNKISLVTLFSPLCGYLILSDIIIQRNYDKIKICMAQAISILSNSKYLIISKAFYMVGLPVMFIFSFVLNFLKNSNIPARVAQLDECHRPVH